MTEPSRCILGGKGFESLADGLIQRLGGASFGGAQELFEFEPHFFNGFKSGE